MKCLDRKNKHLMSYIATALKVQSDIKSAWKKEHSAILLSFIKLPFVINIFVLTIFERPFYKGFTVKSMEIGQEKFFFFWLHHIRLMNLDSFKQAYLLTCTSLKLLKLHSL